MFALTFYWILIYNLHFRINMINMVLFDFKNYSFNKLTFTSGNNRNIPELNLVMNDSLFFINFKKCHQLIDA
jgi:hypothetical protein